MANKKPVELGTLIIDCTDMGSFLQDLPPGALTGLRSRKNGYKGAVNEILSNQPTYGRMLGVTDEDIRQFVLANERIDMIDVQLPAARKLVQMLEETRAKLDDQCQRQVSAIAASAEIRARAYDAPEVLAKYEKTRAYRSASARKAVRTRRKNAELQADVAVEYDDSGAGETARV